MVTRSLPIVAALLACALVACSANPTMVPFLDRVFLVEEFSAAPAMRERVLTFCGNDPGRTMLDPNCINANQSQHIANVGDGNFPQISTELPRY